jgi:hypothetical protein
MYACAGNTAINAGRANIWSALLGLENVSPAGLLNVICTEQLPAVVIFAFSANMVVGLTTVHADPTVPQTLTEQRWPPTIKLLPEMVRTLSAYTELGRIASGIAIVGAGKTSSALSKVAKTDAGLLMETLTEQFPEGELAFNTTTTVVFDAMRQLDACTEHTLALQFCNPGKNPAPEIETVELAYAARGLDGSKNRIVGRDDHDIVAAV